MEHELLLLAWPPHSHLMRRDLLLSTTMLRAGSGGPELPVSYTNRKGQTYTLYRGQTKTGKPRYYFGRTGKSQGESVTELPPGFTISESVNGVVSLVKDRPSLIRPEEVAVIEATVPSRRQARQYRDLRASRSRLRSSARRAAHGRLGETEPRRAVAGH